MKNFKIILFTCIISLFCLTKGNAQTVYITKTGTKYHTKKCPEVKNSSIKIDLKEAQKKGYKACPMCGADKIKPKENSSKTKQKEIKTDSLKNN